MITEIMVALMSPEQVLAFTIWDEARGESVTTKLYVASEFVIRGKALGLPPHDAVMKPGAYKWTARFSSGDKVTLPDSTDPIWIKCKSIAQMVAAYEFEPVHNCTHHWNPLTETPWWVPHLTNVKQVGALKFGILPEFE